MAAAFQYQGTDYAWPASPSGVILSSTLGSSERNLLWLQMGEGKSRQWLTDRTLPLFLGRSYPASEIGKYAFRAFDLSYRWPQTWGGLNTGTLLPTGTAADVLIDNMISDIMAGGTIRLQTPQFSTQYGGAGHIYVMYGTFTAEPKITYLPAGWFGLTVSWAETQAPFSA